MFYCSALGFGVGGGAFFLWTKSMVFLSTDSSFPLCWLHSGDPFDGLGAQDAAGALCCGPREGVGVGQG